MINDYRRVESIIYNGFVEYEEKPIIINDLNYYVIKDECSSKDELEKLLNKIYTEEMAKQILIWSTTGETAILMEVNERLCTIEA